VIHSTQSEPDAIAKLLALGGDPSSGVYLNQPAREAVIRDMQVEAVRDLGGTVPDGYLRLLRATDGVQIDNGSFKTTGGLVAENLDLDHPGVIVIGNSGNNAWFIYDTRDSRFHITNFGFPDERFKSFDTFDAMLLEVMREQGVV
jgi:hypothetical protein